MKRTIMMTLMLGLAATGMAQAQEPDVLRERIISEDRVIEAAVDDVFAARDHQIAAASSGAPAASTRKRVQLAQAGGAGGMGMDFGAPTVGFTTRVQPSRALVIPKSAGDVKQMEEIEEDFGVMAHLLDKAINSDEKVARAMGIAVMSWASGSPAGAQNLYIEGHGAIFLLNVDFPLQPPPAKEDEAETKPATSNEWEEARRELNAPQRVEAGADTMFLWEERLSLKMRPTEYNVEKVERLKKDLVTVLKNAAHIRQLKSDETVTLVVSGVEPDVLTKAFTGGGGGFGVAKGQRVVVKKSASGERKPAVTPARLIIRARKADCEAFQNGKLDFDAFRQKVTVLMP